MYEIIKKKSFSNGDVYALRHIKKKFVIEVTDTFLPFYTKDAIGRKQNCLDNYDLGSRAERWMIGISVMSGCPVRCKFCATGQMKKSINLTSEEIVAQVDFILFQNTCKPENSKEFKINYTRMGEPFLNIENVKKAIESIDNKYPISTHHYISTIGIKDADYSWIKGAVTLQFSIHSFDKGRRDWLIPFKNKASFEELGKVRTDSNLKTTLNLTLVDESNDFSITELKKYFNSDKFFIKLSPINKNSISEKNNLGSGVIEQINLK